MKYPINCASVSLVIPVSAARMPFVGRTEQHIVSGARALRGAAHILDQVIVPEVTHRRSHSAPVGSFLILWKAIVVIAGLHVHRQTPLLTIIGAQRFLSACFRFGER